MLKTILKILGFIFVTVATIYCSINYSWGRGGMLLMPIAYFVMVYLFPDTHRGFKELLKEEQAFKLDDDLYIESLEEVMQQKIKPELFGEIIDD